MPSITCRWSHHRPQLPLLTGRNARSPFPLGIARITPPHAPNNAPDIGSCADTDIALDLDLDMGNGLRLLQCIVPRAETGTSMADGRTGT
ncbi:hypothetical protein [Streptomyces sp. NPDC048639]|uniref:hypothetical protein n=1 Tax=Streptomyces sp. NPDC048639 TaxID=3365581 RepID=UPI003712F4B1